MTETSPEILVVVEPPEPEINVVLESPPDIQVVVEPPEPEVVVMVEPELPDIEVVLSEVGLVGPPGKPGEPGAPGPPGYSPEDDGPSLVLLYLNAKV